MARTGLPTVCATCSGSAQACCCSPASAVVCVTQVAVLLAYSRCVLRVPLQRRPLHAQTAATAGHTTLGAHELQHSCLGHCYSRLPNHPGGVQLLRHVINCLQRQVSPSEHD